MNKRISKKDLDSNLIKKFNIWLIGIPLGLSFLFSKFLNGIYFLLNDFVSFKNLILMSHFSIITICILIFVINILLIGCSVERFKKKSKDTLLENFWENIYCACSNVFLFLLLFLYVWWIIYKTRLWFSVLQ